MVSEIDQAITEVLDQELDRHEAVHQVRKRCKRIRGLIRLVRPAFDDQAFENRCFRDMARELAGLRDAQSMLECIAALSQRFEERFDREVYRGWVARFTERRAAIDTDRAGLDQKLERFLEAMRAARQRAERWKLRADGFSAVAGGLTRTYAAGRRAARRAYRQPGEATFHELRKQVKYHGCHLDWLRPLWPAGMRASEQTAEQVARCLGDEHDLAVLRRTLLDELKLGLHQADCQEMAEWIELRRRELRAEVRPLAERLFAEKPRHFQTRMGAYWNIWRKG